MKSLLVPIAIILIVAGAVVGGIILSKKDTNKGTVLDAKIVATDHRTGNEQAKVQLIEYGDFQCPACASYEPMIKRLMAENGDWINFAFRHFPLQEIHKNATKAAYASEAASNQGKFWEYKDLLYKNQAEWANLTDPSAKFAEYARSLGLDENRFISDMNSNTVAEKVDSNYHTAVESGFNSTPTFIVNGKKISNPRTYEQLVDVLKQADK